MNIVAETEEGLRIFVPPEKAFSRTYEERDMDAMLKEVCRTQVELREQNDDLAALRRRVDLTEDNLYLHMHAVGDIRNRLNHSTVARPRMLTKGVGGIRSVKTGIRLRPPTSLSGTSKLSMAMIRKQVDKELGVSDQPRHRLEKKRSARSHGRGATREGIMSSLIDITGSMAEFSRTLGSFAKRPKAGAL